MTVAANDFLARYYCYFRLQYESRESTTARRGGNATTSYDYACPRSEEKLLVGLAAPALFGRRGCLSVVSAYGRRAIGGRQGRKRRQERRANRAGGRGD